MCCVFALEEIVYLPHAVKKMMLLIIVKKKNHIECEQHKMCVLLQNILIFAF